MIGRRVGTGLLFVAAWSLAAACSGVSPGSTAATGDDAALLADVERYLALEPAEQQVQLAALSAEVERQLYAASGLDAALGGPEVSAASIQETAAWTASVLDRVRASVASGFRRASPGSPDLSQGLFGGMLVTGLLGDAAVSRTNDGSPVEFSESGLSIEGSTNVASAAADLTHTDSKGVTTTLKATTRVLPCPDADGAFVIEASFDTTSTVSGGTGKRAHLEVRIVGIVGDDAQILETNTEVRGEVADAGPSGETYADVSVAYPANAPSEAVVNGYGGAKATDMARSATALAVSLGRAVGAQLQAEAKKAWESGRCVQLQPTTSAGPKGLDPNERVTVSAAPRSRVDGAPTGGSVTATLTAGGASVEPGGKVKADATFTYVAPGQRNQAGTVVLEARSRRGVGRATIEFDTKAGSYSAEGGGDGGITTGTIGDVAAPFTLLSEFDGGSGTYSFSGGMSGTVSFEGSGGGTTVFGEGSYGIVDNGDGTLTLTLDTSWCITLTGACAPTTEVILLTPL